MTSVNKTEYRNCEMIMCGKLKTCTKRMHYIWTVDVKNNLKCLKSTRVKFTCKVAVTFCKGCDVKINEITSCVDELVRAGDLPGAYRWTDSSPVALSSPWTRGRSHLSHNPFLIAWGRAWVRPGWLDGSERTNLSGGANFQWCLPWKYEQTACLCP